MECIYVGTRGHDIAGGPDRVLASWHKTREVCEGRPVCAGIYSVVDEMSPLEFVHILGHGTRAGSELET